MNHMNWNRWLAHEGDAVLTWLHETEEVPKRAICGIWKFVVIKIPELSRHLLVWLEEKCIYACRVAIRLARLTGLASAWGLIVFGPLAIYPGVATGGWALLALLGSWWGVQRRHGKTVVRPERKKEGFYA